MPNGEREHCAAVGNSALRGLERRLERVAARLVVASAREVDPLVFVSGRRWSELEPASRSSCGPAPDQTLRSC